MTGTLQPLDDKFAIVDAEGRPTIYFIQWAQQKQIDIGDSITLGDLQTYLTEHALQAGSGIQFDPDGDINNSPIIAADVQEILDQITATRGAILFRGLLGWSSLVPGIAGNVLSTNGAGADPSWVPQSGGGGGGLSLIGSIVASGSSPTLSIAGIPGTYKDLIVTFFGKSTGAPPVNFEVNFNTSPASDVQRMYAQGGTGAADEKLNTVNNNFFIAVPGTGLGQPNMLGSMELTILEYTSAFWKNFHFIGRQPNVSTGNSYHLTGSGDIRMVVPIDTITLSLPGSNWAAGSTMRIYGRG